MPPASTTVNILPFFLCIQPSSHPLNHSSSRLYFEGEANDGDCKILIFCFPVLFLFDILFIYHKTDFKISDLSSSKDIKLPLTEVDDMQRVGKYRKLNHVC